MRKQFGHFAQERVQAFMGMGGSGVGAAMDEFTEERVGSFTGMGGSGAGVAMDRKTIPTPNWRKIGGDGLRCL